MTDALHRYELCGLVLESALPLELPLLETGQVEADVRITWTLDEPRDPGDLLFRHDVGDSSLVVRALAGGTLWSYPDDTRFWVAAGGAEVRVAMPAHYARADAETYLVGPILGYLLRMRGVPSLHASTVVVEGRAIAIAGPAGAGKSTLTAALIARGHALVSEDVSALRGPPRAPRIARGLRLVKLWPDSAARHGALPLLTPNWDKRYLPAEPRDAATLDAVVVLERAPTAGVRPLEGRAKLVALLDNVYGAYALGASQRAADLEFFGALAQTLPIYAVTRTDDWDDLDRLCDLIERGLP